MGFQGLARMGLADPRDQLARAVLQQGISTLQHQTRVQQLQAQAGTLQAFMGHGGCQMGAVGQPFAQAAEPLAALLRLPLHGVVQALRLARQQHLLARKAPRFRVTWLGSLLMSMIFMIAVIRAQAPIRL